MYGKGVPKRKHSKEFKIQVVERHLNEGVSIDALSAEYGIYRALIDRWRRIFLEHGAEGFTPKPKGRPKGTPAMGRPKEIFSSELERLQYENMKLKMENLYLKKLQEYLKGESKHRKGR